MSQTASVDVCLQVFGKPYQTALTLLSLHKYIGERINKIYYIVEPARPKFDTVSVHILKDLIPNMEIFFPEIWIGLDNTDLTRLHEKSYRHSLRYQYGIENSKSDFLLIIHNDIFFKKDIVTYFLNEINEYFAIGHIGQCWNCPASQYDVVRRIGVNKCIPCNHSNYAEFVCNFTQLQKIYNEAKKRGHHLRWNAEDALTAEYEKRSWPLPECRVNEWCCMIHLKMVRNHTMPFGKCRPFGAYLPGQDMGVAWFRDMNHAGFRAKHLDIYSYIDHWGGHSALFNEEAYRQNEKAAAQKILQFFPEYVGTMNSLGLPLV
ncbi:MAG: hypothetical protein J1E80_05260 [Desulfovibrionaceae bacterium]|nr:hypothetical protein [Desulfovibrionaceae bacterium]